ncbi:Uncharacterised protein [Mycobacterium tuberculosis]|nr:Uncharacterised protein [Mycobacterium tuberculosis]
MTKDPAPTRSLGESQLGLGPSPADISSESNEISSGSP